MRCSAPPHSRSSSHCRRRLYSTVLSVYLLKEAIFPELTFLFRSQNLSSMSLSTNPFTAQLTEIVVESMKQTLELKMIAIQNVEDVLLLFFLCGAVDHTTEIQCFGGYFLHLSCMSKQHTFAARTLRRLHHQRALVSANRLGKASY